MDVFPVSTLLLRRQSIHLHDILIIYLVCLPLSKATLTYLIHLLIHPFKLCYRSDDAIVTHYQNSMEL